MDTSAERELSPSNGRADGQARDPHPSGTTPRMRARRSSRTLHAFCLRSRRRDERAASPFTLYHPQSRPEEVSTSKSTCDPTPP